MYCTFCTQLRVMIGFACNNFMIYFRKKKLYNRESPIFHWMNCNAQIEVTSCEILCQIFSLDFLKICH